MKMQSRGRRTALALIAGAAGLAALAPAASAHGNAARASLPGSTPAWASGQAVAATPASATVGVRVYLAPRGGEAQLNALLTAVSTPGNALYRHFLTPAQYRARFEPTSASVAAVSSWLRSDGMRVTAVEASHRYVAASGSAASVERAFSVSLNTYRHNGNLYRAASRDASVPASVAGDVLGVTGLDSAPSYATPQLQNPPPPAFVNARPCSAFYGQLLATKQADYKTALPKFRGAYRDYAVCGYTPVQFQAAYGVPAGLNGHGVSIGIVDAYAATTIAQDANTYSRLHGTPQFAAGQFQQSLPSSYRDANLCGGAPGWAGEETLDVEASHGMAPGANVIYYGASSCLNSDLEAAIARIDDQNRVSIVSNSYGEPEEGETTGDIAAEEQVVKQGELQGISFLFSSGDDGDFLAATGLRQAGYPASDPWVTGVGGTSTAIGGSGNMLWQTGWGTDKYTLSANGKGWVPIASNPFLYGSGGGYSMLFPRPAYQSRAVPATAPSGRAEPDVAMDADPTTGMLIGETQTFPNGAVRYSEYRIGGTSLASPLFAGMVALASQHAGGRLGFLNPAIYGQAAAKAGTFTDVTSVHRGDGNVRPDYADGVDPADGIVYSVRTFDQDSSLFTARGWDDVTGLGTPNTRFLLSFGK